MKKLIFIITAMLLICCDSKEKTGYEGIDCNRKTLTYVIHYPTISKQYTYVGNICKTLLTSDRGTNRLKVLMSGESFYDNVHSTSAPIEIISLE